MVGMIVSRPQRDVMIRGGNWNYCSLVLQVCPYSLGKRGLVTSAISVFCNF